MRASRWCLAMSIGAGVVAAACAPAAKEPAVAAPPTVDTAAVVAGVAAMWEKWIVADTADNVDALTALMAPDARLDIKGMPPIEGPAAAKTAMAPAYAQLDYKEASATPNTTTALSNDHAIQSGKYMERYVMKGKTQEMTDQGRYAASFVRGADGQWRIGYMIAFVDTTITKK